MEEKKVRSFLYHHICKEGKIFTDKESFEEAKEAGWVEAPWEVKGPGRPPKHREGSPRTPGE